MTMTDPIADMLTRIRNANAMKNATVTMPSSKIKERIAQILKDEGYIVNFSTFVDNGFTYLTINLKYYGAHRERVISGLKRVSRPGLRVYVPSEKLPNVLNGLGIAIVSTSQGVITDKIAREQKIGGEVIAMVW